MQHSALRFSKVVVDSPALILVRHGTKSLRCGGQRWTLEDGDAIAIAGGQSFDVSNRLSAARLYEARWLVWDRAVIEQFAPASPTEQPLTGAKVLKQVGAEFAAAVERAVVAVAEPSGCPDEVARHRLAELLVWLSLAGVRFAAQRSTTITSALRALFGAATAQAWTVPQVADRLSMSEATLRRRLAAEGTRFGDLLADVRMSQAMTLLQSTEQPVAHIAWAMGYESASRFAIRFRERFGFAPTAIRGHRRAGA